MLIKFKHKLTITIVTFLCLSLVYVLVQHLTFGTLNLITDIDRKITFSAVFIWPYVSLFPVIILTLLFLVKRHLIFKTAIISFIIATLVSVFFYMLMPASYTLRPTIVVSDMSTYVCALVYKNDLPNNSFPSLHVAYALIVFLVTQISVFKDILWIRLSYLIWMLTIIASTLLVKQHHILDVFCGLIIGYLSFISAERILCNAKKS